MPADRDLIRFACEHCGRRVKARRDDRGRRCVCVGCGGKIVVPDNEASGLSFVDDDGDGDLVQPPHALRGLPAAVVVSLAIHAVLLAALALVVFQRKDLVGITLIASQLPDVPDSELVFTDISFESLSGDPGAAFGEHLDSNQLLPASEQVMTVAGPETTDRKPASSSRDTRCASR